MLRASLLLPALAFAALSPVRGRAQSSPACEGASNGYAPRLYVSGGVYAPLSNTGSLFFNPEDQARFYGLADLPATAVVAAHLWVGGRANGEVRFSGGTYDSSVVPFGYTAGPLTAQGIRLPDACARFNRVWLVTRDDLAAFALTGLATDDLRDWPWQAGAPVEDGDGIPGNYDLARGDRPALYGEATAWWVMNGDQAGAPTRRPTGMEVQATVTALPGQAKRDTRALVVRYRLVWKPADGARLDSAYVGLWSDMDNGEGEDDFVGTDSTASLIYTYNGDDDDTGLRAYGASGRMGASGVQIVQGPRVDRDGNGARETALRATSAFMLGRSNVPNGMPRTPEESLTVMSGRWRTGWPITVGGNGYYIGDRPTHFQYSDTPGAFWSEDVPVPQSTSRNTPSDRFNQVIFSGPFAMQPGETQDVVVAFPIATVPAGPGSRFAAAAALRTFARLLGEPPFSFEDLRSRVPADVPPPAERFSFALGPLPASTALRLAVETPPGGPPLSLDLFDALGRWVRSLGEVPAGTRATEMLDVSDVPPGAYALRLHVGGAGTSWRRIVVVR